MKLIRCHVENFGGLHQYTAEFTDGLTVILEPNGFGKTTLAEFIRAMFYGFPRSGKDLEKNLRRKYLPWQGGRYGGYLVFEYGGKCYRLERTFGETPRQDKAVLYDEETHRESRDFSPDSLGVQLFGMDADSFLRTTYLPQTPVSGPLSTDSIRAKLANLLEDSDDLASYEKAVQRLKDKRIGYEHYRGTGGSIHEATQRISALQTQLDACQNKAAELEQISADIVRFQQEQQSGEQALQRIRTRLTAASSALAEAAVRKERERLTLQLNELTAQLKSLRSHYPMGLPGQEELDTLSNAIDELSLLTGSRAALTAEPAPQSKKLHGGFLPLLLFGIAAAAMGVCLLMLPRLPVPIADLALQYPVIPANHMLLGGMGWGAAVTAWIAAAFLQMRHNLRRETALTRAAADTRRAEEVSELLAQAEAFNTAYGLQIRDRQTLRKTERELEQVRQLTAAAVRAKQALEAHIADHGVLPPPTAFSYDLDGLKAAEQQLIEQQTARNTRLLQLEQRQRLLQAEADRIPALTDELTRCMDRKAEDTDRRRLLDESVSFLQQARESLSRRYLGRVQTRFGEYLQQLTDEQPDHIAVDSDFEVRLERAGAVRPLSQFSAGQSDLVQLCMRLALSDALFGQERCFLILDDPFVNLDDAHTKQALALLRKLAEDRQIIYLVCSRSRI